MANQKPRDFVGEVSILTSTSAIRERARQGGGSQEVLVIPAVELRKALADLPGVGEPIVQAFMMRRRRLLRDPDFLGEDRRLRRLPGGSSHR